MLATFDLGKLVDFIAGKVGGDPVEIAFELSRLSHLASATEPEPVRPSRREIDEMKRRVADAVEGKPVPIDLTPYWNRKPYLEHWEIPMGGPPDSLGDFPRGTLIRVTEVHLPGRLQ